MNLLVCDLARVLNSLVWIYTIVLLIYAVCSWVPELRRGRFAYFLGSMVEPVLMPIRRVIPPLGGLDLAFLILLLVLQFLIRPALASLAFNACIQLF